MIKIGDMVQFKTLEEYKGILTIFPTMEKYMGKVNKITVIQEGYGFYTELRGLDIHSPVWTTEVFKWQK